MRFRLAGIMCLLCLRAVPSSGQTIRPFKDLMFGQVAAGGGYESWITATNRGSESWTGTLSFYRSKGAAWSPTVDGNPISNGQMALSFPPGSTRTLKITGSNVAESGFCIFVAGNNSQVNFIEGNLTYFVKSGGSITDNVGVMPATEFYLSTIPFEDFLTVALALVNRGPAGQNATVRLTVYNKTNQQVATHTVPLIQNEQWVKYAWEEFGRLEFGSGRLEIQSDVPIAGTALMFIGGQFSSLPLEPTLRTYAMEVVVSGVRCKGQLSIWAEGPYVKGFFVVTEIPGLPTPSDVILVSGQLHQSKLKLHFFVPAGPAGNPDTVGYATSSTAFSFDMSSVDNTYIVGTLDKGKLAQGTFSLLRIN